MRGFFNAIKWEMILDLKEYTRYKVSLLMDIVVFTGTFIIIYFLGVSEGFSAFYNIDEKSGNVLVLIGYVFWQKASAALGYCSGTITGETELGIFEIRLQSKYPVEIILFFRLLVSNLIHIVTYVGIFLYSIIVFKCDVSDLLYMIQAVLVSIPCLIGMYGIGLVLGSISVREKNIGSFVMIIQMALLFISNTLSPARNNLVYLIPFSAGIELVRNIYLGQAINIGLIVNYIFGNLIWFAIGVICFRLAINAEKKKGSFDNY